MKFAIDPRHARRSALKLAVFLACVTPWPILATPVHGQNRVIELKVLAPSTAPAGTQQQWMQLLSDVGADRVSSSVRKVDRPTVEEEQFGGSTIINVVGVIKNNRLLLPGESFSRSDTSKIKRYLQRLRDDGADLAMEEKKAFGLTAGQLADLHQRLSYKVAESTAGESAASAVHSIAEAAQLDLQPTDEARAALAAGGSSASIDQQNELKGISAGTALTVSLQELGLALVPARPQGRGVQLRLVPVAAGQQAWPIGWPLKNAPVNTAPRLFQREDIRIERFQLSKALPAISGRCQVPFLYDWRGIREAKIDLSATEVSFSRKRTSYMVTLSKLLRQAEPPLTGELRMDENGEPFVWIEVQP